MKQKKKRFRKKKEKKKNTETKLVLPPLTKISCFYVHDLIKFERVIN